MISLSSELSYESFCRAHGFQREQYEKYRRGSLIQVTDVNDASRGYRMCKLISASFTTRTSISDGAASTDADGQR